MEKKILEGVSVSRGIVRGKIRIVTDFNQVQQVEHGDIVVVHKSQPEYAVGVMKAGGVICEEGGRLAHICIVALEMGIPCITRAMNAVELMKTKVEVILDADKGVVYDV